MTRKGFFSSIIASISAIFVAKKASANPDTTPHGGKILFKVGDARCGQREYVVYDNGEISGFGDSTIVRNYHPAIMSLAAAQRQSGSFRKL